MRIAVVLSVVLLVALVQTGWGQVGLKATTVMQDTKTVTGQALQFPQSRNQITAVLLEIMPGGEVGRHQHPVPTFVYVLEGSVTIEMEGRPSHAYRQGEAYLEAINTWHNAYNRGTTTAKLLVVFAGEEGQSGIVRP